MYDSIFSPILTFANEQPLIPKREIQRTLDRIEDSFVSDAESILDKQANILMRKASPLINRGDDAGIRALEWGVAGKFRKPIYQVWDSGFLAGGSDAIAEMRAAIPDEALDEVQRASRIVTFTLNPQQRSAIQALLRLRPVRLRSLPLEQAILQRSILLSGGFSDGLLDGYLDGAGRYHRGLKDHMLAAIFPQETTGVPISRDELVRRIEGTLDIGTKAARRICRTESTTGYNRARDITMQQSTLVDYYRFLSISDNRTSDICDSRNGMLIPADDRAAIEENTPAMHPNCRSTISPVMTSINPEHAKWSRDRRRDYQQRNLVPLPQGWRLAA